MERGRFNSSLRRRECVRQHVVGTSGCRKWPGREGWEGDGRFGGGGDVSREWGRFMPRKGVAGGSANL